MTHPAPATLLLYTDPDYEKPEPEDVRAVAQILDMTGDELAGLVGAKDGRAVRRWLAPKSAKSYAQVDYAAWRLMLLYAGLVQLQKRRPKSEKPLSRAKADRPSMGETITN
jgi:hypothetical protein